MPDLDWIRKLCLAFADVTEDMPWDDDLCFKVRGKIFTGIALSDGRFPRLTLKTSSEAIHDLLEIEGIVRAPYVGRYDWIQLSNSNVLPADELEGLIRQSYELVAAKAPKKTSRTPKKKNKIQRAPVKAVSKKKASKKKAASKRSRNS
jgi:predicted DNA-binding protein (MmcQ/YjbR family)